MAAPPLEFLSPKPFSFVKKRDARGRVCWSLQSPIKDADSCTDSQWDSDIFRVKGPVYLPDINVLFL